MLLPYNQARHHMFQELQPYFPKLPLPPISCHPVVNETALANRMAEMILPSLGELIGKAVEKAVSMALHGANITASVPNPTHPPSGIYSSTLHSTSTFSNPVPRKTQPVESYVPAIDQEICNEDEEIFDDNEATSCQSEESQPSFAISKPKPLVTPTPSIAQVPISNIQSSDMMTAALHKIRILTGNPTATWTCKEQQLAMQAVLNLTSDVLALMRTGSGKTMLGVVPSLVEKNKITGVVLPLKSLMADYIRKLDDMRVPYEVFNSSSTKISGTKNLVLVSVDMAQSSKWRQALAEVNERVTVARLVVDEGQLALTAEEYRDALKDPYELRQFPMQFVILSGSLQLISESTLLDSFGMAQSTTIIQTDTVCPELQYILEKQQHSSKDIARRTWQIINHHKAQMQPRDRVLVFVPYIQEGKNLAQILGCKFYNGGEETTDEERQSAYNTWIQGTDKIMVCTAAFGAGNDYPHVRLVIHAGTPKEMIGCIQEKSRAGRDGQHAQCYFLPKSPGKLPEIPSDKIDHQGKTAIHQWLFPTTSICLRFGLTLFCDGKGISCHDNDSCQKCSVCQPSILNDCPSSSPSIQSLKWPAEDHIDKAYHISRKRKIEKDAQALNYVDNMKHSLDFFQDICSYCKVHGQDVAKHTILQCPLLLAHDGQSGSYVNWRRTIKYHGHHKKICYLCHVPQCHDKLHGLFIKGSHQGCLYPDVIAPAVYAICRKPDVCNSAQIHFNQEWNTMEELMAWLNGKPEQGHQSNSSALFLWHYNNYCITN